jgi:hypothetical protein
MEALGSNNQAGCSCSIFSEPRPLRALVRQGVGVDSDAYALSRLISFLISSPLSVAWTISSSCPLEFGWSSRLFRLLFWTNIGSWQTRHEISRSACLGRLRLLFCG